ncbi:methyltransferase domain-containing protein [Saliphagus sp. GCM10025308]
MVRFNSRVDEILAPPAENPRDIYKEWVDSIDFERALHFGSGRDRHELGQQLERKGKVVALDPDTNGLKQNKTMTKITGDGQRLPFADEKFDLVFSEYVFEHLPYPSAALAEIDRVLRPGGSFVVLIPNPSHYYARIADLTPFWFHQLWFKFQG